MLHWNGKASGLALHPVHLRDTPWGKGRADGSAWPGDGDLDGAYWPHPNPAPSLGWHAHWHAHPCPVWLEQGQLGTRTLGAKLLLVVAQEP